MGIDAGKAEVPSDMVRVPMAVAHQIRGLDPLGQIGRQVLLSLSGVPEDRQVFSLHQGAVDPVILLQMPHTRGKLRLIHGIYSGRRPSAAPKSISLKVGWG